MLVSIRLGFLIDSVGLIGWMGRSANSLVIVMNRCSLFITLLNGFELV